jgi:FG-GAP repeat
MTTLGAACVPWVTSDTQGNFRGALNNSEFGSAVAALGDLDGDATQDLVVGAPLDNDGGTHPPQRHAATRAVNKPAISPATGIQQERRLWSECEDREGAVHLALHCLRPLIEGTTELKNTATLSFFCLTNRRNPVFMLRSVLTGRRSRRTES